MSSSESQRVYRVAVKGKGDKQPGSEGPALEESRDVLPRHWFAAALSPSGEIVKKESNTLTGLREVSERSAIAWVDYWTDDFNKNAVPAAAQFGFTPLLLNALVGEHAAAYQDFNTELGLRLPSTAVTGFDVKSFPLLVLARKNFILTVHPFSPDRRFALLRRYAETILKRLSQVPSQQDRLTLLLIRLLEENSNRNFGEMRKIEERSDKLSQSLTDPKLPGEKLAVEIYQMKHALINYLNGLWDTVHVLNTLRYGDADILTDDSSLLDRISQIADSVNGQIGLGEHMSEVLASGLSALQTIYNNQLQAFNNRLALLMTYLTIVGTAILVPNTLATVFGNAVFDLSPGDMWWYAPLMLLGAVGSGWLAYWWIKKQGWLPGKME